MEQTIYKYNGHSLKIYKYNGHSLKIYMDEHNEFKKFYDVECTPKQATKYLKKFKRHFKLPSMDWEFTKRKNGSAGAYWWGFLIKLPTQDIPLGLICHEVAHVIAYMKYDTMQHNKRFYRQLRRVYRWAERYV